MHTKQKVFQATEGKTYVAAAKKNKKEEARQEKVKTQIEEGWVLEPQSKQDKTKQEKRENKELDIHMRLEEKHTVRTRKTRIMINRN